MIEIVEVTREEYAAQPLAHIHAYNSADFAALNAAKADAVHFLLAVEGGKVRFGVVLGERNGMLLSPFSAPFGGFSQHKSPSLECLDETVAALRRYATNRGMKVIITLPPAFYEPRLIAHTVNVLSRQAILHHIDLNYHFPIASFDNYDAVSTHAARKNLHRAMTEQWEFVCVDSADKEGIAAAYDVIRRNREEHGYPLRMSLDDVLSTIRIIPADFFIMRHEGQNVAAAQVFHVAEGIAQVIYWGDLRCCSHLRTMNIFTYRLFAHYRERELRVLDIGPSSVDGVPNYGLCAFKDGIGCVPTPKFQFIL